jgi:hypothetical protein
MKVKEQQNPQHFSVLYTNAFVRIMIRVMNAVEVKLCRVYLQYFCFNYVIIAENTIKNSYL